MALQITRVPCGFGRAHMITLHENSQNLLLIFLPTYDNGHTESAAYVNGEYTINKNWVCSDCGNGKQSPAIVDNDRGIG